MKYVYVVAVSGGVDSVVLLHKLVDQNHHRLIVAHVDHGIREDSAADAEFVARLARSYGLPLETARLNLGIGPSEDTARRARYVFLDDVAARHRAIVVTAHHQDDVLETALINLVRGTSWRGLCSLRSTSARLRPLLAMSKTELIDYAIAHDLEWHEDSTNYSPKYLRNRIRVALQGLDVTRRRHLLELINAQHHLREAIETEGGLLREQYVSRDMIARYPLIMLEPREARELLRQWLGEPLEVRRLNDLWLFAATAQKGGRWSIDGQRFIRADTRHLIVQSSRD